MLENDINMLIFTKLMFVNWFESPICYIALLLIALV